MSFDFTCAHCGDPFVALRRKAKFCSQRCVALSKVPALVAANKQRRIYPEIPGLTRVQVCYRAHQGSYNQKDNNLRLLVIRHLGGQCVRCDYSVDVRGMVLDHKDGDGKSDRARLGGKIARYYAKHLDEAERKLQVLCATCNQIKAFEENEHNKSRRIDYTEPAVIACIETQKGLNHSNKD